MPLEPVHAYDIFSFIDHLTGMRVSLSFCGDSRRLLLSPAELRAHIKRPLELIKAAVYYFALRSPVLKCFLQKPMPSLGFIFAECSPRVHMRIMFGCSTFMCQRLATAPSDMQAVCNTMWCWTECMMERVIRGLVNRVQVWLQPHLLSCVLPVFARVVSLKRAAANSGRCSGLLLRIQCQIIAPFHSSSAGYCRRPHTRQTKHLRSSSKR